MTPPKISIITAVYNAVTTIEETICSVTAQTYPNVEHVVIDGGSTDGTMEILRKHRAKFAVLISEPDEGIYYAMNKGLAHATGEIIGFLNSDDIYVDGTVLSQIASAFEAADVDACYADLVYVDKNRLDKVVRYWRSCPYVPGLFEKGWMPAHPTFFVRKWVYDRYGGFDTDYRLQSDFELTMRFLAVQGIRSRYLPKVLVRMRMGGESNRRISNVIKGNIEAYRACRKHDLRISPWFMIRKVLSRVPQFLRRPGVPSL